MKYLVLAALILASISTAVAVILYARVRQLECDIGSGFTAERKFTYPIFRELGKDPDDYGKDAKNPFLSETRYFHCAN